MSEWRHINAWCLTSLSRFSLNVGTVGFILLLQNNWIYLRPVLEDVVTDSVEEYKHSQDGSIELAPLPGTSNADSSQGSFGRRGTGIAASELKRQVSVASNINLATVSAFKHASNNETGKIASWRGAMILVRVCVNLGCCINLNIRYRGRHALHSWWMISGRLLST